MEVRNTNSLNKSEVASSSSHPSIFWSADSGGMVLHSRNETKSGRDKSYNKAPIKGNTKVQEIKLHTEQRASKRAMFNYSVATKLYVIEQQKKQTERLIKMIEEEEIRMLRKEMVPRAQLMPLFDRPFFPQRSSRPLTVPKEPSFHMNNKCWNRSSCGDDFSCFRRQPVKPMH